MTASNGTLPVVCLQDARRYFEMLQTLAAGHAGKLVLASFGEDPAGPTKLRERIQHFATDADAAADMAAVAAEWTKDPHRNIYAATALLRPHLAPGRKGGEADIAAVLCLVLDFDAKSDPRASDYAARLPLPPDFVIETSAKSYQAGYALDRPAAPADTKAVVVALVEAVGCDPVSKDISHVWRVPGLYNWPNKSKIVAGRSPVPFVARWVKPWDGSRTSLDGLQAAVGRLSVAPMPSPQNHTPPSVTPIKRPIPSRKLDHLWTESVPGDDRSAAAYGIIKTYQEHGYSADDTIAAFDAHPKSAAAEHYSSREQLEADIRRTFGKLSKMPDWVAEMNRQFMVVNENGRVLIYRPTRDLVLEREVLERIAFEDLRRLYMNERIQSGDKDGTPIYRSIADQWLAHPRRRQYRGGVVFAPGKQLPPDVFNMWRGFAVEPKPGDWSKIRAHLADVICDGDPAALTYVLGWAARAVQHPGEHGKVALVLRGEKGTGKGTFGNFLLRAFGQHGIYITHAKHLVGNFNAHLRDAVFVFADEAFYAGDRQHESVLKGLVTDPFLTIEGKHQNAVTARNVTHILLASNENWVVPAGADERRFCVLNVSNRHKQDQQYFKALYREAENGGLAAMLHELLAYDLSGFDVFDVPQTAALAEQKIHSLRGPEAWLFNRLHHARLGPGVWGDPGLEVPKEDAYADYVRFSREQNEYRPADVATWAKTLRNILGSHLIESRPRRGADRPRVWLLSPIDDCRAAFAKHLRAPKLTWEFDPAAEFSPTEGKGADDIFA